MIGKLEQSDRYNIWFDVTIVLLWNQLGKLLDTVYQILEANSAQNTREVQPTCLKKYYQVHLLVIDVAGSDGSLIFALNVPLMLSSFKLIYHSLFVRLWSHQLDLLCTKYCGQFSGTFYLSADRSILSIDYVT